MDMDLLQKRKEIVYQFICDKTYVPMKIKELAIVLQVTKEMRPELEYVLDELIAEGNAASDEETRKGYYKELMELYMEDVPSVAIYANMSAVAHASDLENIDPSSAWCSMYLYKWVE